MKRSLLYRFLLHSSLLVLAVGTLSAQSALRVANVIIGSPPFDVFVDSTSPAAIQFLQPGDASKQVKVAPGKHRLSAASSGSPLSNALLDTAVTVSADSTLTLHIVGSALGGQVDVVQINHWSKQTVPTGTTMVRFIQASPSVGTVSIAASPEGGTPFSVNNLSYMGTTNYFSVPEGQLTLLLKDQSGASIYKALGTMVSGRMVTILISGDFDPNDFNNFFLYALTDNDTNAQTPMAQLSNLPIQQGSFRLVNLATGFDALDFYTDNQSSDSAYLDFRDAGAKRNDLLEGHNIKVGVPGTPLASAILNADVTILPDATTTLIVVDKVGGGQLDTIVLITPITVTPQPTHTPLRVVHASYDAGTVDVEFIFSDASKRRFDGLSFRKSVDYINAPPGNVMVNLYLPGASVPLARFSGEIPSEVVVTAIISGSLADTSLGINLLVDNDNQEQQPMIVFAGIASVGGAIVAEAAEALIAPNPVRNQFSISYQIDRPSQVRIDLYDNLGRHVVSSEGLPQDAGRHTAEIGVATLSPGAYTAVVTSRTAGVVARGKVVIVQ